MKTTKKILLAMLLLVTVMAFGVSAYAAGEDVSDADAITIDSVIFSEYVGENGAVDETLLTATVGFHAVQNPEQVTILLTTENLTEITEANKAKVIYIDQIDNPGTGEFEFVVEKARVATAIGSEDIDGCTLYTKMGGTDLDTMASKTVELEDPAASNIMPGDVDGDGVLSNRDGTLALRLIAGWTVANANADAADVDGDNILSNRDGTLLLRKIAGWNVELK